MKIPYKEPTLYRIRSLNRFYTYKVLLFAVLSLGIILRARQYLFNRSLWLDEASLAWNIVSKSYLELLGILEYGQAAPIGFLFVERFFFQLFGDTEYVLRLFPFLSGVLSLFFFYKLTRYRFSKEGTLIAVFLFAISTSLIHFSSELKQYSSDVAIALILILGAFHLGHHKLTPTRAVLFGLVGGMALCLSHPALFVLGGIGLTLATISFLQKDFHALRRLLIMFAMWMTAFMALYFLSYGHISRQEGLMTYWHASFMPFPPTSLSDLLWFPNKLLEMFQKLLQIRFIEAALPIFLVGVFSLVLTDKKLLFFLLSPLLLALMASSLHKYPFEGRLLLFAIPALLFCLAKGIETLSLGSTWLRLMLVLLIGCQPLMTAVKHFQSPLRSPRAHEEIKPLMQYMQHKQKGGDLIRFPYRTQPAFRYYAPRYGFTKQDDAITHMSGATWDDFLSGLSRLPRQGRVWILLTHPYPGQGRALMAHMNTIGNRLLVRSTPGALLALYDLPDKKETKVFAD